MSKAKELQDKMYERVAIAMDAAKDPGSFAAGFNAAMTLERLQTIIERRANHGS